MENTIEKICEKLPSSVSRAVLFISSDIKKEICEIRLKIDAPVIIVTPGKSLYLKASGDVCENFSENCIITSKTDIGETFLNLCNRSVFAHAEEIEEGYLSLPGGCRAGLGGRYHKGNLTDVYSINIRIAKSIEGSALPLKNLIKSGLLIAGPPGSGKTTILRDAVRLLSEQKIRTCVIDTRKEISEGFYLGDFVDVIIHKDRTKGIEIALRTLSPQVMVFDEIATLAEQKSVNEMFNAGVKVITTAHISTKEELKTRPVTEKLLSSGAIEHVAILNKTPGEGMQIISGREDFLCRS